jgi:galactokinase
MDPLSYRRVKHVITENQRVLDVCEALSAGDIAAVGRCLYASHASLRDDFEVSCPELDALVEIVSKVKGTVGARLTWAGFGGCANALVATGALEAVEAAVAAYYPVRFPAQKDLPRIWPMQISDGAALLAAP